MIDFSRVGIIVFDFDGVFTDNLSYVFPAGIEACRVSHADGAALSRLKSKGTRMCVLTSQIKPYVDERCKKLGIPCHHCESHQKKFSLHELLQGMHCSEGSTMYVGNSFHDLGPLQAVAWGVAVADSEPCVLKVAPYVTVHPGGKGAVKDGCDAVYSALGGIVEEGTLIDGIVENTIMDGG